MSVEKLVITKDSINYTQLPNKVLQAVRDGLSLGIWAYLSSLPPSWEFYKDQIKKHFRIGREKLEKILKTLQGHNLINIQVVRGADGKFTHWALHVKSGNDFVDNFSFPEKNSKKINDNNHNTEKPYSGSNQTTEKPYYGEPVTGFSTPIKETTINKIKNKNERALSIFSPSNQNLILCKDLGLNLEEELKSFEQRHTRKKTDYEFERWLRNSRGCYSKLLLNSNIEQKRSYPNMRDWTQERLDREAEACKKAQEN